MTAPVAGPAAHVRAIPVICDCGLRGNRKRVWLGLELVVDLGSDGKVRIHFELRWHVGAGFGVWHRRIQGRAAAARDH
jgi:hypothetical protein